MPQTNREWAIKGHGERLRHQAGLKHVLHHVLKGLNLRH